MRTLGSSGTIYALPVGTLGMSAARAMARESKADVGNSATPRLGLAMVMPVQPNPIVFPWRS